MTRSSLTMVFSAVALAVASAAAAAAPVATTWAGTADKQPAVSGYDPVSYFNGAPAKGRADYSMAYQGARFRFASPANLQAFKADPGRFAPQFGGFCAWAASQGRLSMPDPTIWHIVGGKLYLNCSKDADTSWLADVPGNIAKAEAFWAKRGR